MKRAALYIRVSTTEQAQEGYSIGAQKERLTAYCKAHDWLIADIYVDGGYSGSNLKRPGIQRLVAETEKFDVVLVYKLDRLSRSQRDTLYLIEESFLPHKVDFVSMQESFDTGTPFGKAMIGLLAVFAQLEREQIKERTFMGRVERAKSGLYRGGANVPIGYDYAEGKLIVNPYEAEQVRKIYAWYLAGDSIRSIHQKVADHHFTNRYASYHSWSSIRNILCNPVYTGRMTFGDVIIEDCHEAIIPKDQFNTAQTIRLRKKEIYGVASFRSKHLLTGSVFCGHCGARYYMRTSGKYAYYACYSRTKQMPQMVKDPNCKNKHWNAKQLEALVNRKIREVLSSPELAKEIAASNHRQPIEQTNNEKIEKRIKEIDRQIAKFMELYQHDDIPPQILGDNISKLYNEKTTLEKALVPETTSETMSFDLAEELLADAAQVWDFADTEQKRQIMQSLINRIVIDEDNVDIEWAF